MPIEIRELIIRTTVVSHKADDVQPVFANRQNLQSLKREIIKDCVEKVKDELLKAKER